MPSDRAKSEAVPAGRHASAVEVPSRPFAAIPIVPSPPSAATTRTPCSAASRTSRSKPGPDSLTRVAWAMPARSNRRSTVSISRPACPRPAAGLATTTRDPSAICCVTVSPPSRWSRQTDYSRGAAGRRPGRRRCPRRPGGQAAPAAAPSVIRCAGFRRGGWRSSRRRSAWWASSRTGKTSLVQQFVHSKFSEKYHSTVGVKIDRKEVDDCRHAGEPPPLGPGRAGQVPERPGQLPAGVVGDLLRRGRNAAGDADRTRRGCGRWSVRPLGDVPEVVAVNKGDLENEWQVTQDDLYGLLGRGTPRPEDQRQDRRGRQRGVPLARGPDAEALTGVRRVGQPRGLRSDRPAACCHRRLRGHGSREGAARSTRISSSSPRCTSRCRCGRRAWTIWARSPRLRGVVRAPARRGRRRRRHRRRQAGQRHGGRDAGGAHRRDDRLLLQLRRRTGTRVPGAAPGAPSSARTSRCCERHASPGRGPATTLTMVALIWPRAYVVHVGDSRAYYLRDGPAPAAHPRPDRLRGAGGPGRDRRKTQLAAVRAAEPGSRTC